MKKLIGTVAALLLVASAAFAEITIGEWGTVIFAPVMSNGDSDSDIMAATHAPWGWGGRAVGLSFSATSDDGNAGIAADLRYESDGKSMTNGDTQVMWVKPIDMLRVSFGKWDYGEFQSGICLPSWDYLRPKNWFRPDDQLTFAQIGNQAGAQLELKPIDGLLLMWNLPVTTSDGVAYKMFEGQHIGAKYAIDSIGTIKLAWVGNGDRKYATDAKAAVWTNGRTKGGKIIEYSSWAAAAAGEADGDDGTFAAPSLTAGTGTKASGDEYKYLGDIWVGFDLTAVENLFVTVGGKIAIASSDYKKKGKFTTAQFGLGASYAVTDEFNVMGSFAMQIFDSSNTTIKPDLQFGLGLTYAVNDKLTAMADFRGYIPMESDVDPTFSFMIGANYACSSNGFIGLGFQGYIAGAKSNMTPEPEGNPSVFPATKDKFAFAVPIKMQVSF